MAIAPVTTQSTQIAKAQQTLSGNYETFLRLLTTQMQNQDPLEPMDATKFTEQLVSYSQVEQQIATNTSLNSLISLTKSAAGANAVNYLGKTALTAGPVSSLAAGEASWRYTLPRDAASIQINVTDANGRVIRSTTGDASVGMHDFTWNGASANGTQLPDGPYTLSIVARLADGTNVPGTITGVGQVNEIDMSGIEPLVTIGSRKLNLSDIIGLKN